MLSKSKRVDRDVAHQPSVPKALVEHFLTGPMTEATINAATAAFQKALIEATLNAEPSSWLRSRLGQARTGHQPSQRPHDEDRADGGWHGADRDAA